jgi:hypothetical protein
VAAGEGRGVGDVLEGAVAKEPRGVVDCEGRGAEEADEDEREQDQDLALAGIAIARLVRRDLTPVMSARRRVPATGHRDRMPSRASPRIIGAAARRGREDL